MGVQYKCFACAECDVSCERGDCCANIYSFNQQSQKTLEAIGFYKTSEEWYHFDLTGRNQHDY